MWHWLGILLSILLGFVLGMIWHRRSPQPLTVKPSFSKFNLEPKLVRYIIDHAPVGYLQVDDENRLIYHNAVAVELLGTPPKKKHREPLLKWVRCYELDQLVSQTRLQQQSLVTDWVWQTVVPDPENPAPQPSRALRGHSIKLGRGQVGIFLEDRQEVSILSQQCDRWTSDIAHELKTPLTSIRLLAETLQPRIDQNARDWLERLLNEVIRLSTLVQDLLELNQAQMGRKPQIKPQPVCLQELIAAVWNSLEPIALKRKVQLATQISPEVLLSGDPTRLYRLFLNLLDNALKHSPALQQVLVKAEMDLTSAQAVIDVIDCGEGFPEVAMPHVFERFYRGDPARCRYTDQGGSGLGLAIAKQIVQLHQGSITVMNHPDTRGGQVQVRLPLDQVKLNHAGI